MKLKTRLVIAFFTIIIIPVLMAAMMVSMVCRYQIGVVEKNYGITGTTISDFTNSMQVLARVTEKPYHELKKMSEHTFEMEDATELDQFNKKLENKNAYLLVRKDGTIVYTGSDDDRVKAVIEQLPGYGDTDTTSENGIYLGGDAEALVKQVDFRYDDGNKGSAFIVSDVSNVIPEVGQFFCEILIGIVVILILTSAVLIIWIYRAVMGLARVTQKIANAGTKYACFASKYDKGNKADRELLEIMKKNLGDKVLNTVVPFSRAIKNSISYRITASEYMAWINPARCYEQLANEIIHSVEQ